MIWASPVVRSREFDRVAALPRRALDPAAAEDLTPLFALENGRMSLWPIQSLALLEADSADGLFAPIRVGGGKSLICLLLPDAMRSKKAVLLVQPDLKIKALREDVPKYGQHFRLPAIGEQLHVVSYTELSSADGNDGPSILDRIAPDLIVADECQNLARHDAARTRRFLRYMKENPKCRFAGLSGTVTRKSIRDYQHLVELALRARSPLPNYWPEICDWADALDVGPPNPKPPGILLQLCTEAERASAAPPATLSAAREIARSGYRRRLVETPGVVATDEGCLDVPIVVRERVPECVRRARRITDRCEQVTGTRPAQDGYAMVGRDPSRYLAPIRELPEAVHRALATLRKDWRVGDEEIEDAIGFYRAARQLAQGFYYRWAWPGGVPDREWLVARAAWQRVVRDVLGHRSRPGLDSPALVARAADRGDLLLPERAPWVAVMDRPAPPVEAVWLSDYLLEDVARWADEGPGIVWFESRAFGEALTGVLPVFAGGDEASREILTVRPETHPAIACSVRAHGTGINLQSYSRNLFVTPPANGATWEQVLGRTHRPGQGAERVTVDVFAHTEELRHSWRGAVESARYVEQTTGQRQKLLQAEVLI